MNVIGKSKALFHSLIVSLPIFIVIPSGILGFLTTGSVDFGFLIAAAVLIALVDMSANVLNNISDWEIDIINKKRHVMHEGIKKRDLWIVYFVMLLLVAIPLYFLPHSVYLYLLVLFFIILGIIYSYVLNLKDKTPYNYICIALAYGVLPFAMGFFSGNTSASAFVGQLPLLAFLGLATFSYTITKDYGDTEGDAKMGKKTLPVLVGKLGSVQIQAMLVTVTYLFLALLISLGLLKITYLVTLISFAFELYIIKVVHTGSEQHHFKKAALYNKFNHFILRILLIAIILFL